MLGGCFQNPNPGMRRYKDTAHRLPGQTERALEEGGSEDSSHIYLFPEAKISRYLCRKFNHGAF